MNFQYSIELKQKLIKNFKKEHNVEISEETANEYLSSLADLYESFIGLSSVKQSK